MSVTKKSKEELNSRIRKTFNSILIFNWILVCMGVAAFALAIDQALGGNVVLTGLFGVLGTADVISLFKFSMDRVQRSLGDQVQVEQVDQGLTKEMDFIFQLKLNPNNQIDDVKKINEEIRKSTLNSMELIQNFTKIAEPLDNPEPWLRVLPVRFSKLQKDGSDINGEFTVTEGQPFTLSGSITNVSKNKVKITSVVIAIRPPGGTPDGGPFRFDFCVDDHVQGVDPKIPLIMKNTKCIETNVRIQTVKEEILKEWYRKDWYAFMTCQTSDGCWNDDHNKYWFELKPANPPNTQPQVATTPQVPVQTPTQASPQAPAQDPNSK